MDFHQYMTLPERAVMRLFDVINSTVGIVVLLIMMSTASTVGVGVMIARHNHTAATERAMWTRSTGHIASDLTPCGRKVCADVAVAGEMYRHLPVPTTINTLETKKGFEVGVWFKQGEQTPHAIRPHFVEQWSYAMLVVMALVSGVLGFVLVGLVAVVLDEFVLDGIEERARRRAANPTSHTKAKKAKKAKPALWSSGSRSWA